MDKKLRLCDRCKDGYSMDFYEIRNLTLQQNQNSFLLLYCMDGELEYRVSFEKHRFVKHDFVLVDIDEVFSLRALSDTAIVCVVGVSVPWIRQYFPYLDPVILVCDAFSNEVPGFLSETAIDHVRSMLGEMIARNIEGDKDWHEHIRPIFQYFTEHFALSDYRLDDSQAAFRQGKEELYSNISRLISESYKKSDCVAYVRSQLHYSPEYLNRVFRAFVGNSIQEGVNDLRCWSTEHDLIFTDRRIVDIAAEHGFSDTKYYYKYFRHWYNMTPNEFRRQCRENLSGEDNYRRLDAGEVSSLLGVFEHKRILVAPEYVQEDWRFLGAFKKKNETAVLRIVWSSRSKKDWIAYFTCLTGKLGLSENDPKTIECMSVITYGLEYQEERLQQEIMALFPQLDLLYSVYMFRGEIGTD